MLSLLDPRPVRSCQGFTRREMLQVGGLGLLGLSLPQLLRAQSTASSDLVKDKSVILLFLQGGPSHIEFFDPKMSAPEDVRSVTGETKTTHTGITFGGSFTKTGALADQVAVVRSYASMNGDHSYLAVTSAGNSVKATMSALYARVAGANHPRTGMPRNVLVLPEAVQPGLKLQGNFETSALPTLTTAGELGSAYAAFDPSGGAQTLKNLKLSISAERLADRRSLLSKFDTMRRDIDGKGTMETADRYDQQAFDVITRGVAKAFDLSKEDPRTVAKYDTSKLFEMKDVTKWYDMRRGSNLLGKQLLLARRLCESGCGFVTVSDCGWDMHANGNSPKGMKLIGPMSAQIDHVIAAFVEDCKERGLSDKILLVVTGEMGRSPRRNRDGGRDHYANMTPLLFAGGGLKMGQVIGQSDKNASQPTTTRYTPKDLLATVLHTLLDPAKVRLRTELGRVANIVSDGEPIPALV